MPAWTCPACNRAFGRTGQSHVCAPSVSVDRWFAGREPRLRAMYDAVAGHLEALGPVTIEAVGVGILFKRSRTFAELRPKRYGFVLTVLLSRPESHPRASRVVSASRSRFAVFTRLGAADDVDDTIRGWLTESYLDSLP